MKRVICLIALLVAAGCSFQPSPAVLPTSTSLPTPTLADTATPVPIPITGPSATPAPTLPPSPTPFTSFQAKTTVDNVNVRVNPGYLFDVSGVIAKQGSFVAVLGKAPGGEWINVQVSESQKGWLFAKLLQADHDLQAIPIIEPSGVQTVKGILKDGTGMPVSGIQFSLIQGSGADMLRNDAVTDANGEFMAFMPKDASGSWIISYSAIACTSNMMDANCNCKNGVCGSVTPPSKTVTLPVDAPVEFDWR